MVYYPISSRAKDSLSSNMKKTLAALTFASAIFLAQVSQASAQVSSSWSQCTDGRGIVRCETFDCPRGDTNGDGRCTLTDNEARLTDSRNDSFCANPISGCGQVRYYPSGASVACLERVEEAGLNCDLYAVANPNFTPTPTTTPKPTASARATATPKASDKGGDSELPKTGPEHVFAGALVLLMGAVGVFLYEKYKVA
jgi:hypothetical protein